MGLYCTRCLANRTDTLFAPPVIEDVSVDHRRVTWQGVSVGVVITLVAWLALCAAVHYSGGTL